MPVSSTLRALRIELLALRHAVDDAFQRPAPGKVSAANDHYELARRHLRDCQAELDRLPTEHRRLAIGADASLAMQVLHRGDAAAWPPVAARLDLTCSQLLDIIDGQWMPEEPAQALDGFIPAKDCRTASIDSRYKLDAAIEKHKMRTKHQGRHKFVHAGDWHAFRKRTERPIEDLLDDPAAADFIEVMVERTAAARRSKNRSPA